MVSNLKIVEIVHVYNPIFDEADSNIREKIGDCNRLPVLRLDSNQNLYMIGAASNYLLLPTPDSLDSVNQVSCQKFFSS
jgi:hypothetical protein